MTLTVNRAEANLLTVARVAVGVIPPIDAMRVLVSSIAPPPSLGPSARFALSQTLARGTVLSLAKQGGWRADGGLRLWERNAAPPLIFTGNTVRLLSWVLMTPLAEADASPLIFEGPLTLAEDLLVTLLLEHLRGTGCENLLARQLSIRSLPLTTLTHVAAMSRELAFTQVATLKTAQMAPFVEGVRTLLSRAWLAAEVGKADCSAPEILIRVGQAQGMVLDQWLKAIDEAGRRDLATFIVDVAVNLLTKEGMVDQLTRSLSADGPLRERTEARRRAAALLRSVATLRQWDQQHRAVHFIDENHAQVQRLIADWSRLGEQGFSRAAAAVSKLDTLPLT